MLQAANVTGTIVANENRLRLSVSVFNTHDDIDRVVDVFKSSAHLSGRRHVSETVKSHERVMDTSESARLAALRSYRILDTEPEQAFDDIVLLASQICGTPISLITLVDEDRQWFKARVGVSIAETSRSVSFCSHAIKGRGIFVVDDALEDVRFRENPMVQGEPHIRFYAGAPLVTSDGHALGTLCIVDHVPRTLTDGQRRALDALRRQAEAQLELRRNLIDLGRALAERNRAEAAKDALVGELRGRCRRWTN